MKKRKIFLADDDQDDWYVIRDAMEQLHAAELIVFASNGEDMLALLEEAYKAQDLPCLVVLDLNMPKMNGTQTLEIIKADERFRQIPVIIYSTSINMLEKKKCMDHGAYDYLTKPISFQENVNIARMFIGFCSELS